MCMIDDADGRCEIWNEKFVRGRKEHKCTECGRPISVGERHRYIFSVFEGDAFAYRQCQHCAKVADWLNIECRGYMPQGVQEDFEEHALTYRRIDLLRVMLGQRRGWKKKNGELMPVPHTMMTSEAEAQKKWGNIPIRLDHRTEQWDVMDVTR